jgi:hypothetical protein
MLNPKDYIIHAVLYKPTTSGGADAVKEESLRVSSIKLTFASAL